MSVSVKHFGFGLSPEGGLEIGRAPTELLAKEFGTPLHVVDEDGVRCRVRRFREAFEGAYAGPVQVHYALKCNSTPGVVRMVLEEGVEPEAGTPYEWALALRLGIPPDRIVVNGPHKGALLNAAVREGAGLIVVDGPQELALLETVARAARRTPRVLLRINPDCVPRGMNRASATGSRRGSVFGFDWAAGEVEPAVRRLAAGSALRLAGFHCHVGTGISEPGDYERPARILVDCLVEAQRLGIEADVLDVGGGFGVSTSRELNTSEFLMYQAVGRLPGAPVPERFPAPEAFARRVASAIEIACERRAARLPRLLLEPGRALVSSAGALLVTVGSIKHRPGVGAWAVTDGGAGTVAFPMYYEYHEVLLCRAPCAERTHRYTLVGPACFSADWICRNKPMPGLLPGDVLAVCDAGAYFTVQESNFGFPRPAIVSVRDGVPRLLRRRETFDDMVARDIGWEPAAARRAA
jgi:diaminopimelate decarboxylase